MVPQPLNKFPSYKSHNFINVLEGTWHLAVYFEAHNSVHNFTPYFFRISFNNTHLSLLFSLSSMWPPSRSQWPRGLRRRSAAARLLRSWVRIPPGTWTSVCCECCVLSGRRLWDELITRPEDSYRLLCVAVCDLESSSMRRPWSTGSCCVTIKK